MNTDPRRRQELLGLRTAVMTLIAMRWRSAYIERSRSAYQDLLIALGVAYRRALSAVTLEFSAPRLAAEDRRGLLAVHAELDRAYEALEEQLVGTPKWWSTADVFARRVADALDAAEHVVCKLVPDPDSCAFEDTPTMVFTRPTMDLQQTLPA